MQQTSITDLHLARFGWLVALVVVLRVLTWDLHHALDQHPDADERCQVCLVMERGGDGVTPAAAETLPGPCAPAPAQFAADAVHATPLPCPLPRGPPASLS